jgi:hypothetical protein
MAVEKLMKAEPAEPRGRLLRRQVLTEDDIRSVRQSSLAVLEQVGILIEHPRALALLAEAGAAVGRHRVEMCRHHGGKRREAGGLIPKEHPCRHARASLTGRCCWFAT